MTTSSRIRSLARRLAEHAPPLKDAYRVAVQPRWELDNWRDYFATRRGLRWLRQLPAPAEGAPRALLVLRREDIFDVKCRSMLGAALKLEGVEPVVLTNDRRVPRIHRYVRAFGLQAIRSRDELPLDGREHAEIEELASELMERQDDFASVLEWTHRGHRLGERVLSTLIRETLEGQPDLADPDVRRRMRRILVEVLHNYRQAEKVLDALSPRWVLADESGYAMNGPLVDVAISRGSDVIETTPFLRAGSLLFKRVNQELGCAPAASVSPATFAALAERPWTAAQDRELIDELEERYSGRSGLQKMYQGKTRSADRRAICRELGLDPGLPLAVVFCHVLWDSSFFYGSDLFLTYRAWLEQTLRAAAANPRVSWLIKAHPSNLFRLRHGDVRGPVGEVEVARGALAELPGHIRLVLPDSPISSLSLFREADVGITVRSTAGLEMACFGKPVLTAGSGHYSGLGFTHDSHTAEEYLERLRRLGDPLRPLDADQTRRARVYAHALMKVRPWILRSFRTRYDFPENGRHPLDRNLVPAVGSLAEAEAQGDLHRWAAWAVRSRSADYLEAVDAPGGGPP